MRFEILNVEHGFAAYALASDGSVLLFDCGHSPSCRPSEYLPAQGIRVVRRLLVTNYDEDHIGDLPTLRERLAIEVLTRNASLTSTQLCTLKTPPISPAMRLLLEMIDSYTVQASNEQLEPPGLRVWTFHNSYPGFTDTNNLSLLTFLDVGSVSFVLPGDLERSGWLALLANPQVRRLFGHVNVFVASHHGRGSGYCKEVFDYCRPRLVVMSDGPEEYDTQRMVGTYAQHATGEWFNGPAGREWRKVVTTRSDGHIRWEV
ncbi:MAG TPA: MBL fold metallo-hydrolase [Candidatus Eisenbacteria bacterium]